MEKEKDSQCRRQWKNNNTRQNKYQHNRLPHTSFKGKFNPYAVKEDASTTSTHNFTGNSNDVLEHLQNEGATAKPWLKFKDEHSHPYQRRGDRFDDRPQQYQRRGNPFRGGLQHQGQDRRNKSQHSQNHGNPFRGKSQKDQQYANYSDDKSGQNQRIGNSQGESEPHQHLGDHSDNPLRKDKGKKWESFSDNESADPYANLTTEDKNHYRKVITKLSTNREAPKTLEGAVYLLAKHVNKKEQIQQRKRKMVLNNKSS